MRDSLDLTKAVIARQVLLGKGRSTGDTEVVCSADGWRA
jgi:hypothetical protein